MKHVILHILCEGQTEERFVKEVLAPYLCRYGIFPKPILLLTSRKQNSRGGMISFVQAKRDMEILMRQYKDKGIEKHLFTTMFDYYALPDDFPGKSETASISDHLRCVEILERDFAAVFGNDRILPYIQQHEFEALLFTDITKLIGEYPEAAKDIVILQKETERYGSPEDINDRPETAPSKRIIKTLEHFYHYNKVKSGATVANAIGLPAIMARCCHFRGWVERIISLAETL